MANIYPSGRPVPPFPHIGTHTYEWRSPRPEDTQSLIGAEDMSYHLNDVKGPPKIKSY